MLKKRIPVDPYEVRKIILEQSHRARVGHIGCSLSIADILSVLYSEILNIASPEDPQRDRFVLSKGHAAPALHAALYLKGWITTEELATFHQDGTYLGIHPEINIRGVELATGSLGQGLSAACGMALASKIKKENWKTYAVLSDAECNEGSVWEAAAFASQHSLSHLIAIVDWNEQQGFGYTKDIISTDLLAQKWKAFGWDVKIVDGHSSSELSHAFNTAQKNMPMVILARTTLGKGVTFMEKKIEWHYLPLSDEQYVEALESIKLFHTRKKS